MARGRTTRARTKSKKSCVVRVTYGRTINIGNYESVRIDLTADCVPGKHRSTLCSLETEMLLIERRVKRNGTIN